MADFVANKDGGMAEAGQENVAAPAEETKLNPPESETAASEETKPSEEVTEPEGDEKESSEAEQSAEGSEAE